MNTIAKLMVTVAAIVLCGAATAQVTYDYAGGTFGYVLGQYTTSDSVQGSVTFAAPLAANLNDAFVSSPVSYSLSDGLQTLTNLNSSMNATQFWTNAEGAIPDGR